MCKPITYLALFFISSIIWSCQKIDNVQQFNNWLNDPAHGCIQSKRIAGAAISVKYQPPKYLLLKDSREGGLTRASLDSIAKSKTLTFLLQIGPDEHLNEEKQAGPIRYDGASDMQDYAERVTEANFFMNEHIGLYIGSKYYRPALVIADNVYELTRTLKFMIVFSIADAVKSNEYLVVYDDPFFGMGKVQFPFSAAKLSDANRLKVNW